MSSPSTEVLICGAGAAGLTLALDLARRGVSFRLVDKLGAPFGGSRGKGIQPRTQEVLEDLGLLDRVVAAGGEYPVQRTYRDDGTTVDSEVMEPVAPTPDEPHHLRLLVPQFLTEGVLREGLAELGCDVEFGVELLGFEQDDQGVTVRLSTSTGEETVRARHLVGADGGRSAVRRLLGVGFEGRDLGVRAVVADVDVENLGRDAWHRWGGPAGPASAVSLCPLPGTSMFQLQAPVGAHDVVDTSAGGLTGMLAERTGRDTLVVRSVSWASVYAMSARLADRYRVGRVLLTGDAAHVHPPTGGQGLNTSMQDAANLGWKLAAVLRGAPDALLDTYERERRPVAAQMLGLATSLLDAAKQGSMRRGREVHQLDLGYTDQAAVPGALVDRGVLAGDRAPDAPMRGAAGLPVRMFDLTRGPHWTAVGYEAARGAAPAARAGLRVHRVGADGDVRDVDGYFARHYGVRPGDWVVVRPDGYVGVVVGAGGRVLLEEYLRTVGLGPGSGCAHEGRER